MNSIVKNITDLSGYHFPFEGEKHLATCLLVPYREDTWRDNAKPAIKEYLSIVKAIAPFEPVVVIIDPRLPPNPNSNKAMVSKPKKAKTVS